MVGHRHNLRHNLWVKCRFAMERYSDPFVVSSIDSVTSLGANQGEPGLEEPSLGLFGGQALLLRQLPPLYCS